MAPGFVKLTVPVIFFFAISIMIGNNSGKTLIELGIEMTFLYCVILVTKFLGLMSYEIGIRILAFNVVLNCLIRRSVTPFTAEYCEPVKLGTSFSLNPSV